MSRLQMFLTVAYFVLVLVGCQIKNRSAVTGMFSDVSVSRIKTIAFMLSALLAGLAGIMASCSFSGVHPNAGTDLEFQTIAGAVIGGTALTGGVGTVLGTIMGSSTLLALRAGLVLMGANVYVYRILLGPLLVAVVAIKEAMPRLYKK
jgi:ribose/xylose/arabinose/galactoside ABC-type transport system permease subunit